MRAYLRLVRFPLAFTAVADGWAGYWIGLPADAAVDWGTLAALAGISACFYMLGMALNDLADREQDRIHHPGRPIPSGRITPEQAAFLVLALAGAGLALLPNLPKQSFLAGIGLLLTILAYDLRAKRSAAFGSLAMGVCRFLNMYMGLSVHAPDHMQPALILGTWVAIVTLVSTLEEKDPRVFPIVRWGLLAIIPLDAALVWHSGRPDEALIVLSLLVPRFTAARFLPVN